MPAKKSKKNTCKIKRHGFSVRFVHWSVTISTLVLIFTGIGQMPMYRRYMVDKLPGMAWSSDFAVTLNLHYWAAALLIFAATYHLMVNVLRRDFSMLPKKGDLKESYHIIKAILTGGKEPSSDKYLAEQRLAYAFIGASLILLIVTGAVKVAKNLPGFSFPESFTTVVTTAHNVGTILIVLGLVGHMAAFLFKKNRCLLPCMFSGYVEHEYVQERHGIWYTRLCECGDIVPHEGPCPEKKKSRVKQGGRGKKAGKKSDKPAADRENVA